VSLSKTIDGYQVLMEVRGRIELREHEERLFIRKGVATAITEKGNPKIRPKGLRAFDREDAGFFLELLPGPYDPDGIGGRQDRGRVAPGDYSPRAPTDPYVPSRAYGSSHHEFAAGRYTEWIATGGGSGYRPNTR
jgi:hypothetical protein